jgi:hypothetical protein
MTTRIQSKKLKYTEQDAGIYSAMHYFTSELIVTINFTVIFSVASCVTFNIASDGRILTWKGFKLSGNDRLVHIIQPFVCRDEKFQSGYLFFQAKVQSQHLQNSIIPNLYAKNIMFHDVCTLVDLYRRFRGMLSFPNKFLLEFQGRHIWEHSLQWQRWLQQTLCLF